MSMSMESAREAATSAVGKIRDRVVVDFDNMSEINVRPTELPGALPGYYAPEEPPVATETPNDVDLLQAHWCNTCEDLDTEPSASELYEQRRNSVELFDGTRATIRTSTEEDQENIGLLYRDGLTEKGRYTRFLGSTSPEAAQKIGPKLSASAAPERNVDLVAVHEDTGEIIAHGGFIKFTDSNGEIVAEQHLIVDKRYANPGNLTAEEKAARKGKGLGTAMAKAILLTAKGYGINLTAEVAGENSPMKHVMAEIPKELGAEDALSAHVDYGNVAYRVETSALPDCRLCAFGRVGMLASDCPIAAFIAERNAAALPDEQEAEAA